MSYIKKRATAPFNGRVALEQMFKEAAKPSNARYDREIDFAAASALHVDENLQERVNGDGVGESNSFINKVKYGVNPIAPVHSYTQTAVEYVYAGGELISTRTLVRGPVFDKYHPEDFTKGYSWVVNTVSGAPVDMGIVTSDGNKDEITVVMYETEVTFTRCLAYDCSYDDINYYSWYNDTRGIALQTTTPIGKAGLPLYVTNIFNDLLFTETPELVPYVDAQNLGTHLWYEGDDDWVDATEEGRFYINRVDVPLIETHQGEDYYYYFSRSEYNDPEGTPTYPEDAEHMYAWGDGSEEGQAEEPETAWKYCYYTTTPTPTPVESASGATPLYEIDEATGEAVWVNVSSLEEGPVWITAFKGIQN